MHARLEETVAIKIEVAVKSLMIAHALRECHQGMRNICSQSGTQTGGEEGLLLQRAQELSGAQQHACFRALSTLPTWVLL